MGKPFTAMEPAGTAGASQPKKRRRWATAGAFAFAGLVFTGLAAIAPNSEQMRAREQREAAEAATAEARCKADLKCLSEKHLIGANAECRAPIERFARYDVRWDKSIFEARFSHYRWKDQARGIVTFVGDRISFQNGFGAWQPHSYECDFDTNSRTAIAARVTPGRL